MHRKWLSGLKNHAEEADLHDLIFDKCSLTAKYLFFRRTQWSSLIYFDILGTFSGPFLFHLVHYLSTSCPIWSISGPYFVHFFFHFFTIFCPCLVHISCPFLVHFLSFSYPFLVRLWSIFWFHFHYFFEKIDAFATIEIRTLGKGYWSHPFEAKVCGAAISSCMWHQRKLLRGHVCGHARRSWP